MDLKHHYKLINSADYKDGSNNRDGYYTICVEDLKGCSDIEIIGGPMQQAPRWIRILIKILRILHIPRSILSPLVKAEPDDGPEVCILLFRLVKATPEISKGNFYIFLTRFVSYKDAHNRILSERETD